MFFLCFLNFIKINSQNKLSATSNINRNVLHNIHNFNKQQNFLPLTLHWYDKRKTTIYKFRLRLQICPLSFYVVSGYARNINFYVSFNANVVSGFKCLCSKTTNEMFSAKMPKVCNKGLLFIFCTCFIAYYLTTG